MNEFSTAMDSFNRRFRFPIALTITALVYWLIMNKFSGPVIFMICWISFVFTLLVFFWTIIFSQHPKNMAMVASEEDASALAIFLITLSAAVISLFAVIILLQHTPNSSKTGLSRQILLSVAAVACSWTLIHTLFTMRYAHLYYSFPNHEDKRQKRHSAGLIFPNEPQPDFIDFAYFSFVLGMTFQVSDVQITGHRIRRLVLIHSLLSFIYNTAIVAFSINIISGVIGK